jgi:hypothetical protein
MKKKVVNKLSKINGGKEYMPPFSYFLPPLPPFPPIPQFPPKIKPSKLVNNSVQRGFEI